MEWTASEQLIAQAIGQAAMMCLEREVVVKAADSAALALIDEIGKILNDTQLDDPECFYRIEAIVSAFRRYGADVSRHDFE